MANTYTITVNNQSGVSQAYMLFCDLPVISGPGQAFTNVFMQANPVPSGHGSTTFTITRQFYAICGTSVQNLQAGVTVATSDWEAVTLGANNQTGTTLNLTVANGGVSFPLPLPASTSSNGAYTIQTDSSFSLPDPNNTFTGLGGMNMNGVVVPVATFLAAPSSTYNISPVVRYYIATGSYNAGQIINIQQIGTTQLVDFTNSTSNSQTFIQNNKGLYSAASEAVAKEIKLAALQSQKAQLLGLDAIMPSVAMGNSANGTYGNGLIKEDQMVREMQKAFLEMLTKAVKLNA